MENAKKDALERFLRYVKIDTQSDDKSETTPSALKELNLAKLLKEELEEIGLKAEIDEYGRLYSHLDGEGNTDVIGLNSHMDTALECPGKDVKPQIITNYDGKDIKLNDEFVLSPKDFPALKEHIGDTLVTTSGDTLLGGDDKAGVALIMSLVAYLKKHPEIKHHPLAILFTPDEEIGRGPEHFNKEKFGAKYAYTVDGDYPDHVDIDNFNAAHAELTFKGVEIHPGEAKEKMINAISLAMEFDCLLPSFDRPENTEGFEGFNHLLHIEGSSGFAKTNYILRNHDKNVLAKQKQDFKNALTFLKNKYPKAQITLNIEDDYHNMHEVFLAHPEAITHAEKAFKKIGLTPLHLPVRGGTDGATFSFKGCPTPNLGTGSYNHHGRYEYLSVRDFNQMWGILLSIVTTF